VQVLNQQTVQSAQKAEVLRKEVGYFHKNRKHMNYLEMRSEGYPIGSGMVGSAAKQYRLVSVALACAGAEGCRAALTGAHRNP
jgi:hypothetical protein